MKASIYLCVLCACGTDSGTSSGDDPPVNASTLERCLVNGGTLEEAWSVGNQHGPVTAIAAGEIVVLGSADGSVKQWTVDGDEPLYGTPFVTAGASIKALAMSEDGHVLAGTEPGGLAAWTTLDAASAFTDTLVNAHVRAVAYGERIIAGTARGQVFTLDPVTHQTEQLESTLWGASAIGFGPADALYTAGHWYGLPQIERRLAGSPTVVSEQWRGQTIVGQINALATNDEWLVAAGEHVVAVFSPNSIAAPRVIATPEDHDVVGVVLFPGGTRFATAGREGTLRVWETATAELVSTLAIPTPTGVASDNAGAWLYTSGPDGTLHVFGCTNGG